MSKPTFTRAALVVRERDRFERWLARQGAKWQREGEKTFDSGGNGADACEAASVCYSLAYRLRTRGLR